MITGYICILASLLMQVLASMLLFDFSESPLVIFYYTALSVFVVFSLANYKSFGLLLSIVRKKWVKVIFLNLAVFIMLIPLYYCITNGLPPAIYILIFSATMGFLSLLERKNCWCLSNLIILIIVFLHFDVNFTVVFSLAGPLGTYGAIKIGSDLGISHQLSTSQVMVLRFFFTGIASLLLAPYIISISTELFVLHAFIIMIIIIFMFNIFSIYFTQKSALHIGHKATSTCYVILPFLTFIAQEIFLGIDNNYLIFLSIILIVTTLISLKFPWYFKK